MFQFPSNGESVSKADQHIEQKDEIGNISFNSLQTGKRIQRKQIFLLEQSGISSFNSLQTGKRIQSMRIIFPICIVGLVSIPFKRESVSKGLKTDQERQQVLEFQFPSNGKAYPKTVKGVSVGDLADEMFQFPSNGKAYPK